MAQPTTAVVDYRANPSLRKHQMAFHWWDTMPTSLHRHNHYEIFIITHGAANHFFNGETHTLQKGILFLVQPEDCHQFTALSRQPCVHMNLGLTQEKIAQACSLLGFGVQELLAGDTPCCVTLREDELSFFTAQAGELGLLQNQATATDAAPIIIGSMITQALTLLYKKRTLNQASYPLWFSQLLQQIHAPEFLDCSAQDIYSLSGYSPPAIIAHFKKYTGKTIAAYLQQVKMDYACMCLRTTAMSTLDIAGRLGYDSLSHFNRLFKQYTGQTPREYKKQVHTID